MKLYLVRHAIAEPRSTSGLDADRALTDAGREKMDRAAQGLVAAAITFDLILTSPLRRARETASILSGRLGSKIRTIEALEPGCAPRKLLAAIGTHHDLESVALVGHEPDLGEFASFLIAGSASACPLPFKKGAIACLDFDPSPSRRPCRLLWFLPPRLLRGLAGRPGG